MTATSDQATNSGRGKRALNGQFNLVKEQSTVLRASANFKLVN